MLKLVQWLLHSCSDNFDSCLNFWKWGEGESSYDDKGVVGIGGNNEGEGDEREESGNDGSGGGKREENGGGRGWESYGDWGRNGGCDGGGRSEWHRRKKRKILVVIGAGGSDRRRWGWWQKVVEAWNWGR